MKNKAGEKLTELATIIRPLYIVGGYVRDSLLGYSPYDVDITSPVPPEEVKNRLKGSEYKVSDTSLKMLTLKIAAGEEEYEYTTFRADTYTSRGHAPSLVQATDDIVVDAKRRDFTVNAIYYDIANDTYVDPLGGERDLKSGLLRTTVDPDKVFSEDGLRLMRLARIAAELDFDVEPNTLACAAKYSYLIDDIAPERIRDELNRILVADTAYGKKDAEIKGLELLRKIGVLERILPELTLGVGMAQRPDYHKYDVYHHTLETVRQAEPSIRLAALMHDIAKPSCFIRQGNFHFHDVEGERVARKILSRLNYSKKDAERVAALTRLHMFNLRNDAKESTLRRFVVTNLDVLDDLMRLKQADYLGGGLTDGICPQVTVLKETYDKLIAEGAPMSIKDLLVNGNDLIELDAPTDKRAEILRELLFFCVNHPECDTSDKQKKVLKEIINNKRTEQ